jgi:hypothetical protein
MYYKAQISTLKHWRFESTYTGTRKYGCATREREHANGIRRILATAGASVRPIYPDKVRLICVYTTGVYV